MADNKARKLMRRVWGGIALLAAMAVCLVLGRALGLDTTTTKTVGAFVSVPLVCIAVYALPERFAWLALGFDLLAAGCGSVLNLYHYIGGFDKFVHGVSGVVLAEGGILLAGALLRARGIKPDAVVQGVCGAVFAMAGAGVWEIYEFSADTLLHTGMQGGNSNTMGDIISGVIGGLAVLAVRLARCKKTGRDREGTVK